MILNDVLYLSSSSHTPFDIIKKAFNNSCALLKLYQSLLNMLNQAFRKFSVK